MGQYYIYSVQCSYHYNNTIINNVIVFIFIVFFLFFPFCICTEQMCKDQWGRRELFDTVTHGVSKSVSPCTVVIFCPPPPSPFFFYRKKNVFWCNLTSGLSVSFLVSRSIQNPVVHQKKEKICVLSCQWQRTFFQHGKM